MQEIFKNFPVTTEEYQVLEKRYGDLAQYQAWQLYKKNSRNNHTEEQEDMAQDLRVALLRAGSYYKRQTYIESCLYLSEKFAEDKFVKRVVQELQYLWKNKTRHGASRQKFGPHQERILERLVRILVPARDRPSKKAPLRFDTKFNTYCKAITWNCQKSMGKKITKEKTIRTGLVSLSEFDYLGA